MALSITVIVCTRNRPSVLPDVLGDLRDQAGPGVEVLVVDQSDPDEWEMNRRWVDAHGGSGIRHLRDPLRGLPAARNLALAEAQTDLVWFIDDDMRIRPGAVEAIRLAFDDPRVGGASGRVEERRVRLHPGPPRLYLAWDGRVRQRIVGLQPCEARMLPGGSFAARREALRAVGPCDAGFGGTAFLEDADWSTRLSRAGWRLVYVPDAVAVHLAVGHAGCRAQEPLEYARWRFHNTARWLRRHRPWGLFPAGVTFGAIALRAAWQGRSVRPAAALARSFHEGWRSGGASPESGRGLDGATASAQSDESSAASSSRTGSG